MAKKIDGYIKLQIPAGQANPSPPVGPALGQKGVNIILRVCSQAKVCVCFTHSTSAAKIQVVQQTTRYVIHKQR